MIASELRALFPYYATFFAADADYSKPTTRWLREDFWAWFREDRASKGLLNWSRTNDCDGFARAYAQAAADCHAVSSGKDEGLAVGEYCYHSAGGPHAIVFAVTEAGLIFIEPQTGRQLELTEKEKSSCFWVRA